MYLKMQNIRTFDYDVPIVKPITRKDLSKNENLTHLDFPVEFNLSEVYYEQHRIRYTIVKMLADFGGFNDGLFLIASFITSSYAKTIFLLSFAHRVPVIKPKPKRIANRHQSALESLSEKLKTGFNVKVTE